MGLEPNAKGQSQVLIYPPGSKEFIRYDGASSFSVDSGFGTADNVGLCAPATTGIQKLDSLSKFFDSVIDGTADLRIVNQEAAKEEPVPDPEELEIERLQEEQRIALLHGGFADMNEFQEALKNGAGHDFHAKSGFPGKMDSPHKGKEAKNEDPIHQILKAQKEAAEKSARAPKMDKTGASGEQVVVKAAPSKDAEQPRTSAPPSSAPAAEESTTVIAPPPSAQSTAASAAAEPAEETTRAKDEL